ncbi:MAG: DUF115 domain-containing protein [Verrucomicrobiota bacterium]|nr:DUF115 domain-containing protein [Verrucomicrobiota bacterium]
MEWNEILKAKELADELRLVDVADFGIGIVAHVRRNGRRKLRSLLSLKGAMKDVPAIVVGAGPSLRDNGSLLEKFQNKALLIAAGTALEAMETRPSLAVAVDRHVPLRRTKYFDVPLCLQGRVHPESLRGVTGELLYLSDSHFPVEPWLMEQEALFDTGWTVGNGAVAIAAFLGCNPIVLIGMDFCYRDGRKYAHKEGEKIPLVEARNREGNVVSTQRDWLLAAQWMEEFAAKHPEISFLNATTSGLPIFSPVALDSLQWPQRSIPTPWADAPRISLREEKLAEWRHSLEQGERLVKELLLDPLWQIWKPLFERQTEIPFDEEVQKSLFFEQVIAEHLMDVREAFYPDGSLRTVEMYRDDVRDGETILFWPNGQRKRRLSFVQGKRHGLDEMWNEAGVLVDRGMYEEGSPVGVHQRFRDEGTLIEEIEYLENGQWNFRYGENV